MGLLERLKLGNFLTDEQENYPEVDIEAEGAEAEERATYSEPAYPKTASGVSMKSGNSIEMKVVKPEGFENCKSIADLLLSKKTVLLNLEDTNKEAARRLIDFLSGVAYAIGGDLNVVANGTFVITPSNVDVSDEDIAVEEEQ